MDTTDASLDTSNETGCENKSNENVTQDESSPSSQNLKPWTTTGDKFKDDLKLFTTGSFYDCNFKVSNDATGEIKLFRCHKVFLASCSEAFDKMLFGPFKEANVDRDFEICITKTSPDVFELAMSYVYGRCVDFKGHELAVQVYFFARQWMIVHLIKAVEQYLIGIIDPENVLGVSEHFVEEASDIRSKCLEIIKNSTKEVMRSKLWVKASKAVVRQVLRMYTLQMDEATLFHYLVKWGRTGTEDDDEARSKIDDGLKLIKFCAMSRKSFSNLCCSPLPLSMEEKFKILLSITERNSDLLPEGFSVAKYPRFLLNRVNKAVCMWQSTSIATSCTVDHRTPPFSLRVSIDAPRYLTGLILSSLTKINAAERVQLTCEVFSPEHGSVPVGSITFDNIIKEDSIGSLYMKWPVLMQPAILYTITLSYQHKMERRCAILDTKVSSSLVSVSKGDNVTVHLECDSDSILDIYGLFFGKKMT